MKTFDFNAIEQPTWPVVLRDKARTTVNLTTPTVDLVDRFLAMVPGLEDAAQSKDGNTVRAIYNLVAEIMNCNADGFTFTAEELRDKYKLTLLDVFRFVSGYIEFVHEMQNAKN
jgi:hypothetical protein